MKYRPFQNAVFLIAVLLLLLGLSWFSKSYDQQDGRSQDGFKIGSEIIKYPSLSTFLMDKPKKADENRIDSIVTNLEELVEETVEEEQVPKIPDLESIDTSKIQRIEYPADRISFVMGLREALKAESCRIIHYGDSQIEGDRISSYIRNRLQGLYGGSGPGFIPVKQVYEQISAKVSASENWERYAYFDPTQQKLPHKKYGAYNSISRFTTYKDSIDVDTVELSTGIIHIGISDKTYANFRKFNKIGLHYGNSTVPAEISVYNSNTHLRTTALISDGNYHNFQIDLPETPNDLRIEISSKVSPDFYGITLDGNSGISLDNVAMRGGSGTVFAGTNPENFSSMYRELDPRIIILQYGGNSVPYIKDSTEVQNYVSYLKNHISWLQRRAPKSQFLYIGPSDLTIMENGQMITYPLLPSINDALKEMCLANNVAYWDMFEAMGGKNSMPYWVEQKLAGSDYTHFTFSGSKLISELFFLALYMDVNEAL